MSAENYSIMVGIQGPTEGLVRVYGYMITRAPHESAEKSNHPVMDQGPHGRK